MRTLRILLCVALTGSIVWMATTHAEFIPEYFSMTVQEIGIWGPLVFIVIYSVSTIIFIPALILTIAGGVMFGPLWGTIYNLTGAMIGAALGFLIARYFASDWVTRKSEGILKKLIEGVNAEGWRSVALTRLVPIFPFSILNYAFGLTQIPFLHYIVTSLICILPATIAYTWLGYTGREIATGDGNAIRYGLLALALIAIIIFLPSLVRRLRS